MFSIRLQLGPIDQLMVTPPEEEPPDITQSFTVTPLSERLHIRNEVLPGNTRDTVTFVYFSKYVDFARWEIVNMPFGWSAPFSTFIGEGTPLSLITYRLNAEGGPHTKEMQYGMITMDLEYEIVPEVRGIESGQATEADSDAASAALCCRVDSYASTCREECKRAMFGRSFLEDGSGRVRETREQEHAVRTDSRVTGCCGDQLRSLRSCCSKVFSQEASRQFHLFGNGRWQMGGGR